MILYNNDWLTNNNEIFTKRNDIYLQNTNYIKWYIINTIIVHEENINKTYINKINIKHFKQKLMKNK